MPHRVETGLESVPFQIGLRICKIELCARLTPLGFDSSCLRLCVQTRVSICLLQGKVHLELRLSEVITDNGVINHKLATR